MNDLFDRYLDGELTETEAESFLAAINQDAELEAELRAYEEMLAAVAKHEPAGPSLRFTDRVMDRIAVAEQQTTPVRRRSFKAGNLTGWAWAAGLVLVFGLGYLAARVGPAGFPQPSDETSGVLTQVTTHQGGTLSVADAADADRLRLVRLVYAPPAAGTETVTVAGTFNDWNPDSTPLQKEGNVWTALLILPPGSYEYMFVENGENWITDPLALQSRDDGFGRRNAVLDLTL